MNLRSLGLLCIAGLCAATMPAETPPLSPVLVPVEAELLAHMQVRALKPGGVLFARVAIDWTGPGCVLRRGATLEAKVVAVTPHSSASSSSEVALSFARAQCGRSDMEPFALVLAAVAAPDDADSGSVSTDLPMIFGGNTGPSAPGSGLLRSSLAEVDPMLINLHRFPKVANLRAGDVLGIKGVTLSVGTGPENSSVLKRNGRDLELFQHTRFLLVPTSATSAKAQPADQPQPAPASAGTSGLIARPAPGASGSSAEEDVDTCIPPACSIVSPSVEDRADNSALASIQIGMLGYAPRLQTEMEAPDQDEALAYLSPTELLVAFNPHRLVPRYGAVTAGSTVRVIRAALVDVPSLKVVRTVDWRLPDMKQYLWALARHRVLVHVGNELHVYGPGLKVEARIALAGPLAFVRPSPDGKIVAVGVVKERHTAELHARLRESLGQEPDEDVEVLVLNESFETIATAMSTSDRLPPTLLNEGQVKLLVQSPQPGQAAQADKHYRLQLRTWDNLSRSLGRFTSNCTPDVSSLAPDLMLLVTCDKTNQAREYRVMRADGKLVLRGHSMLKELGHAASGDEESKAFAVRVFQADEPVLPGEVFHGADLQSAEFGVYRSADGKHLFSARVSDPAASSGGYAMAPGGRQLAVLTRDRIALYAMPLD
jgi:hypothetical protein